MSLSPRPPGIFLTGAWRWLVMLSFEVDPKVLEHRVPKGTLLDRHNDKVFVSLVGFLFRETRVMGISIPWHGAFEEVNLRFYVRREVGDEVRRGVVFIREIVPKSAIALVAMWAYNEPYIALPMRHTLIQTALPGDFPPTEVSYQWLWQRRWNELRLVPTDGGALPVPGSHEEFVTEHYYGYTPQKDGSTVEYRVEHPSWRQWSAKDASFDVDVASLYGKEFAPYVKDKPYSAFLAEGSPIVVRRPTRIK